MHGETVKFSNH